MMKRSMRLKRTMEKTRKNKRLMLKRSKKEKRLIITL